MYHTSRSNEKYALVPTRTTIAASKFGMGHGIGTVQALMGRLSIVIRKSPGSFLGTILVAAAYVARLFRYTKLAASSWST